MTRPTDMTKTVYNVIKHMQFYGGTIYDDPDDNVSRNCMTWGTLLSNGDTKWHRRNLSHKDFWEMRSYLRVLDYSGAMIEYELNSRGLNLE